MSSLVHKFICPWCKSCYTGETCHPFITTIDEHIKKNKKSQVSQHLYTKEEWFSSFDLNFFSILDSATTRHQTKSKESMYFDWEKPNLNKQKNPSVYYLTNLIGFYGFSFFLFIFEFITINLIAFIIVDFL